MPEQTGLKKLRFHNWPFSLECFNALRFIARAKIFTFLNTIKQNNIYDTDLVCFIESRNAYLSINI
jgi:hypothetical protein